MGYIPSVGEKVRIRQWDDMAEQYGVDDVNIPCGAFFMNDMRYLCGE